MKALLSREDALSLFTEKDHCGWTVWHQWGANCDVKFVKFGLEWCESQVLVVVVVVVVVVVLVALWFCSCWFC